MSHMPNDQQNPEPLPPEVEAFAREFKNLILKTGLTYERLAQRTGVSDSALSRYGKGECLPKDQVVIAICDVAKVAGDERLRLLRLLQQARDARGSTPTRPAPPASAPPNCSEPVEQHHDGHNHFVAIGRTVRRHPVSFASAAVVVAVVFLGAGLATGGSAHKATDRTINTGSPSHASRLPSTTPPAYCDRYEVAPRDLWLRDEYGGPLSELTRAQQVTVESRVNPAGLEYWYVTADDNRQGWVDHRYLRPRCD